MSKLTMVAEVAKIVEAVAATIALGLGAWWFVEQRETYPRADVAQTIEVVPVKPGTVAVEVHARFENTGKKLIQLSAATVMLQVVSAEPYDYAALAQQDGDAYWLAKRPLQTPIRDQFNEGELRWPMLKLFDRPINHRVEPGETDVLVFTFLVPCTEKLGSTTTRLGMVRIASDILKPANGDDKGFAWKARSYADVSSACRVRRGVRR